MDIKCKFCGRFLFKQMGTVVIEGLKCPNNDCKAKLNFKIINADIEKDIRHKFINDEQPPKAKEIKNESN
jgi:phage FluMu protein Com